MKTKRKVISFFIFSSNVAPVEWNWQGKTEVLGEKPIKYHFVNHKSQMDRPGIEPGRPWWYGVTHEFTFPLITYTRNLELATEAIVFNLLFWN
jgi:hypothetical protein